MNSNFSVLIKNFIGTVILIVHILAMASLSYDVKFLCYDSSPVMLSFFVIHLLYLKYLPYVPFQKSTMNSKFYKILKL